MTGLQNKVFAHQGDAERMARDVRYPTEFEWGRLLFLLGGQDYEARTVENVRTIVEWQRARIEELERIGTTVLVSQVYDEHKKTLALGELAGAISGPWSVPTEPAPSIAAMRATHQDEEL